MNGWGERMGTMKTMVCIPCMDLIQTDFVKSLIRMAPKGEIIYAFEEGSLVYKSRNELAEQAVANNTDYTLWLDSDMVFPDTLLIDLMEDMKGRDMVTGVCHMRREPYKPCIWKKLKKGLTPEENQIEGYDEYPRDGIFEVDGCGFACVMVRTSVIKTVIDRYHEAFAPLPGYGEDISFCIRARNCGFNIHCDPKIQIGHIGKTIVTDATFQLYRMGESK